MKPTKELIWALRRAAARILDPAEDYDWNIPDKCNCGLLVRELCGLSENQLTATRAGSGVSCWAMEAPTKYCSTTHRPLSEVFDVLKEAGFEAEDFALIEFCGQKYDEDSYFVEGRDYQNPLFVSAWFKQLADKLEQQLTGTITTRDEPTPQPDRPFATRQTTTNTQHITA